MEGVDDGGWCNDFFLLLVRFEFDVFDKVEVGVGFDDVEFEVDWRYVGNWVWLWGGE